MQPIPRIYSRRTTRSSHGTRLASSLPGLLLGGLNAVLLGMAYFMSLFMIQKAFSLLAIGTAYSGYTFGGALTLVILLAGVLVTDYRRQKNTPRLPPQEHQPVYRTHDYRGKKPAAVRSRRRKPVRSSLYYQAGRDYSIRT